jgi:hypothetical protein
MKNGVILVQSRHIDKGIEKYKGELDERLQRYIDDSPLVYTVYRFQDNRILLVYHHNLYALLYENERILLDELETHFEE